MLSTLYLFIPAPLYLSPAYPAPSSFLVSTAKPPSPTGVCPLRSKPHGCPTARLFNPPQALSVPFQNVSVAAHVTVLMRWCSWTQPYAIRAAIVLPLHSITHWTAGMFGRCPIPMEKGAALLPRSGPTPESAPCRLWESVPQRSTAHAWAVLRARRH